MNGEFNLLVGDEVWDRAANALCKIGVATVDLPPAIEEVHARSFKTFRHALDRVKEDPSTVEWIPVDAGSTHATGYHTAGGDNSLSRYNEHREGFVFSDDQMLDVDGVPEFRASMVNLSSSMHAIANQVMEALELQLDIPKGWFQQNLGPTASSSQFHVKRYFTPSDKDYDDNEPQILLPMHTDPSLISVVIHDAPGRNHLAMGLEYFCPVQRAWQPVPYHGHGTAVVFLGSVLSFITSNALPSVKHRVVRDGGNSKNQRVAATLFVRPQLEAKLHTPPSTQLQEKNTNSKQPVTFSTWIARVSRNYGKRKKKLVTKDA